MNHLFARGGGPVLAIIALLALGATLLCLCTAGMPQRIALTVTSLSWLLLVGTFFFLRDPHREIPADDTLLICPADGRIVDIRDVEEPDYLHQQMRRISIFMSVFNVHVNRAPIDGIVDFIKYNPGKFISAFNEKASEDNENLLVGLRTEDGSLKIAVRFIAGLIARRIVFYPALHAAVDQGERINLIRFGSRVDLFCPLDAEVLVSVGDRVSAGTTIMARINRQ